MKFYPRITKPLAEESKETVRCFTREVQKEETQGKETASNAKNSNFTLANYGQMSFYGMSTKAALSLKFVALYITSKEKSKPFSLIS